MIPESELGRVPETARSLLDDPDRLAKMSAAMRSVARPDAAEQIAEELIGACGRSRVGASGSSGSAAPGMSALALVAHEWGAEVGGSDRARSSYVERLEAAGIPVAIGHDAAHVPDGAEVIVSSASRRTTLKCHARA